MLENRFNQVCKILLRENTSDHIPSICLAELTTMEKTLKEKCLKILVMNLPQQRIGTAWQVPWQASVHWIDVKRKPLVPCIPALSSLLPFVAVVAAVSPMIAAWFLGRFFSVWSVSLAAAKTNWNINGISNVTFHGPFLWCCAVCIRVSVLVLLRFRDPLNR